MDDTIKLLKTTYEPDKYGVPVPMDSAVEIFCSRKEITRNEFYNAGRNGFNPSFVFEIFKGDYQGESIIEYNGLTYSVYRTYEPEGDYMELYVERKGGTNGRQESDP